MFDDIMVPKSYLKGLLTKEEERMIRGNDYQTKSLENSLYQYKIYKQKLFIKEDKKWSPVKYTGEVVFYDNIKDEEGNSNWVQFRFIFLDGKVDAKYLDEFKIHQTIGEIEEADRKWKDARKKQLKYESTLKYKIYFFIFKILYKLLNKVRSKVTRYGYDYGTTRLDQ